MVSKMNISRFCATVVIFAGLNMNFSASAENGTSASAHFHGTLIVVECDLNSGQRQTVNFGDAVGIHHINGSNYEQIIPFTLDCSNYSGGNMPTLTLIPEGTATSFNEAAVATNITGLGIELRSDGKALPLNKAVDLDYGSLPTLTAVPVADTGIELKEGAFNASVRLIVEVP
ncbi:fimbrial protein [Salmonella enterica subsp. enterica]|nr:fimbrial protein [Salmonella enterica subsp. enterica]